MTTAEKIAFFTENAGMLEQKMIEARQANDCKMVHYYLTARDAAIEKATALANGK